ncbi:helix-turn-helix domain-containing protein [Cloacibacterium normanense]|uniref:helix-turn-helix domain-containing protein n=1 Tax=Cloacibacterium normanense TaxID=237258 RepID=UPI00391AA398
MNQNHLSPQLQKEFNEIKKLIQDNFINQKEVLSSIETCKYLNISYSKLTKLTSRALIPFYRPTKGSLMFFKAELHDWIRENKVYSEDDVEEFIRISGKKRKKS